jgi:hypothetical protein
VLSNASGSVTGHRDSRLLPPGCALAIIGLLVLVLAVPTVLAAGTQRHRVLADSATATSIHETGTLHLVSHQGTKILHEQGQASGTFHGSLTANIKIAYTQATVSFTISPPGGSVSGEGVESYFVAGKNGHFSGTMYINRGTGRFSHVRSSAMHISGLIKRAHYELTLQVSGTLQD